MREPETYTAAPLRDLRPRLHRAALTQRGTGSGCKKHLQLDDGGAIDAAVDQRNQIFDEVTVVTGDHDGTSTGHSDMEPHATHRDSLVDFRVRGQNCTRSDRCTAALAPVGQEIGRGALCARMCESVRGLDAAPGD